VAALAALQYPAAHNTHADASDYAVSELEEPAAHAMHELIPTDV
jgi:hypothetical protein